jgi:hypothetical protein
MIGRLLLAGLIALLLPATGLAADAAALVDAAANGDLAAVPAPTLAVRRP